MKRVKKQFGNLKLQPLVLLILFVAIASGARTEEGDILTEQNDDENLPTPELPYSIVGTNQLKFYDNQDEISKLEAGNAFYGQDASYTSISPDYTDNGDGTINDNVTGLMWEKAFTKSDFTLIFNTTPNLLRDFMIRAVIILVSKFGFPTFC